MIRILDRDPVAHDTAFEILEDGQRYVSLQLWDPTGDNALVYLTRAKALKLAKAIAFAAETLPTQKKRKTR